MRSNTHLQRCVCVCVFFFSNEPHYIRRTCLEKQNQLNIGLIFSSAQHTVLRYIEILTLIWIFFFEFYVNLIGSVQIRRFLLMKMEFSLVQFEMHVNTHTHTQWERFKWINIEHSEYEEKKRNTNNSHVLFRAYLYTFCNNQFAIWHFQIQKAFHGLLIFVDDCITNAWHLPIKERQMKHGAY